MRPRLLAGVLGAVVAVGIYAILPAGPQHPTIAVSPMRAVGFGMAAPSIHVIDPTPVRLVIASINVDAKVESRGLDASRNLASPSDFRDVAWYNRGPKPGAQGNAIINGHVNWWTGDAVFTHLSRVKVGDEVRVIRADGGVVVFTVTARRTVDANARVASLFEPSSTRTLTLITCSGVWNPLTQSDTQRLIVSASIA
jgi:LPXTG-site transpeptidase (sortase) family protein